MSGGAPIYSLIEDGSRTESAVWAKFSAAKDRADFYASWLAILCMQIERVGGGVLLLGPEDDGAYVPAAVWPHAGHDMKYLSGAAERALTERRGIVMHSEGAPSPARDARVFVGYPIEVSGVLHGAVVLDIAPSQDPALQRALRLLHWASAWLVDHVRRRSLEQRDAQLARVAVAMSAVATAIQQPRLASSALAVANELAGRLSCDRVSIGLENAGSVVVQAISHTATFDPKMDLARLISEAMAEVLDVDVALVHPPRADDELPAIAHSELAREFNDIAVCSVPLIVDGYASGVVTFERVSGDVFDPETVELCKTVGGLLGPILQLKQENDRGQWQRLRGACRNAVQILFGPRHPGAKLVALAIAGLLVAGAVVTGTYRITAKTVIEGAVQRVTAAPFDGYILQSFVRAGDAVRDGQILFRLDDKDLTLEQTRLLSEREQLTRKHRQSLAAQDRPSLAIIGAQITQVEAALALVADKLSRATIVSPFAGVVISGDLSQLLGTPVEQGKILFQIAPLDSYRVILQVDERDISQVAIGHRGELILSGIPDKRINFALEQITPVSTAQEGRNFFRVEARLLDPGALVRPGMEGIGKIAVGERKMIWIWSRSMFEWLQLSAWKWMP